jgi:hypothetical protein
LVLADTRGIGVAFSPPLRYRRGSVREVRESSAQSRDGNGAEGLWRKLSPGHSSRRGVGAARVLLLLSVFALCAGPALAQSSRDAARVADSISPGSLKAAISFLASDALGGRATPSPGLTIAAEYIASEFRGAGLEEVGGSYFQTAPENLRNVVGVLPGSDPALRNTYVLVTAHYDHLGSRADGEDRIYNGANDDASGTASVVAVAKALAALLTRPRRSLVFLAFFGEEQGGVGSRYYVEHPLFPLRDTVAVINLEQLGRTDDAEGPREGQFAFTGSDYSTAPAYFERAAKCAGVRIINRAPSSDAFFLRADNATFARAGVPAHTISVTYMFPDYHQPGDEWQKLDYPNLARVDRAIALGVMALADAKAAPQWNAADPNTAPFREAREKLSGGQTR